MYHHFAKKRKKKEKKVRFRDSGDFEKVTQPMPSHISSDFQAHLFRKCCREQVIAATHPMNDVTLIACDMFL